MPKTKQSVSELYAHLSAQKRELELQMETIKADAIKEIFSSKDFERGAPYVSTAYGKLIAATKSRYTFDEATLEKVKEKKNEIRNIEDEAVALGKATLEVSQYLTLRN